MGQHPNPTGSIFVRLRTVNGNTVRILPTFITFFLHSQCGGTQVFIEGRQEPLVVKENVRVVANLIRRAYRALLLLGLLRNFPWGGAAIQFGTGNECAFGNPFGDDDDCEEGDDDNCAMPPTPPTAGLI